MSATRVRALAITDLTSFPLGRWTPYGRIVGMWLFRYQSFKKKKKLRNEKSLEEDKRRVRIKWRKSLRTCFHANIQRVRGVRHVNLLHSSTYNWTHSIHAPIRCNYIKLLRWGTHWPTLHNAKIIFLYT